MTKDFFIKLEHLLIDQNSRKTTHVFNQYLHKDFIEISQSGLRYGKEFVLTHTPQSRQTYKAYDFEVRFLSKTLVQVLYKTFSQDKKLGQRHALRNSLWKLEGEDWQMIFHQGTPASELP